MTGAKEDTGLPRGALLVIAVGLLACVLAAVLSGSKGGSAAAIAFESESALPDSKPAAVPGSESQMRLVEGQIRVGEPNDAGYRLYRTSAVLAIDAGAPVGSGKIRCAMQTPKKTAVAQTQNSRSAYPRPSLELDRQPVPEVALVEFSASGSDLATVELKDAFKQFSTEPGVKLEWPPYRIDKERWTWYLPSGPPKEKLELGFAAIWRTTAQPSAKIGCNLTTSAGEASVETSGALGA
jgi:hypothetical protein